MSQAYHHHPLVILNIKTKLARLGGKTMVTGGGCHVMSCHAPRPLSLSGASLSIWHLTFSLGKRESSATDVGPIMSCLVLSCFVRGQDRTSKPTAGLGWIIHCIGIGIGKNSNQVSMTMCSASSVKYMSGCLTKFVDPWSWKPLTFPHHSTPSSDKMQIECTREKDSGSESTALLGFA